MQNKKELKSTIIDDKFVIVDSESSELNKMGMLYKAYNIQTKEKISIKLVDVDYIFKNKGKEERKQINQKQQRFNRIMSQCSSDYICHLQQAITNDLQTLFIMDYVGILSLDHQLFAHSYFKEIEAIIIMEQLLEGLKAIENHQIICKYLNLRSIRFSEGFYKIGNYEMNQNKCTQKLIQICKAPQLRENEPYNQKVDIYSMGIILFLMVDRQSNYAQKDQSLTKFLENQEWNVTYLSHKTKNLLRKMLQSNIQQRICLSQVIQQVKGIKQSLLNQQQRFQLPQKLLVLPKTNSVVLDSIILQNSECTEVQRCDELPLRKMQSSQIQVQLSVKQQITTYYRYNALYLQALKTQFMYNILLRKGKVIDQIQNNIQLLQVIYLISTRLFLNMTNLRTQINQQLKSQLKIDHKNLLVSLSELIKPLNKRITQFFNQICKKLAKKENQKVQIVKRRWKIIRSVFSQQKKYDQYEKFMEGVEGVDYSRKQQIIFTKTKLKKDNLFKKLYNTKEELKIAAYYESINQISVKDLSGLTFEEYVVKAFLSQQY